MLLSNLLMIAALTFQAGAPSVFIPAGASAWWISEKAQGRVIGTQAGVVSAEQLNKFIEETQIYNTYKVCALTNVTNNTYVGLDKKTQDDITQTLKSARWRVEGATPDGKKIIAQSVLFEACDDSDNRGAAVLVSDASNAKILMFERMGTLSNGAPIWTAFLDQPKPEGLDAPLFSYSHCTECGAETAVYYDVTRQKIYGEYNGH